MNNFSEKVNFIWSVADLIRDTFKRSKYQDVILPLTVLRRIDCVLQPTKEHVLEVNARLKDKIDNLAPQLCKASGFSFYNTSLYDFERLLSDAPHLAANLKAYINGFSDNMREVLEKFDFNNTISKLEEAGLLFLVMEKFKNIDLHPDVVLNLEMGYIFEEIYTLGHDELEPLSQILRDLNEHFGTDFTEEDKLCLVEIEQRLAYNTALEASVRVNPPENARHTFDHVVNDLLQDMIDGHFKFYKHVNDDPDFAKTLLDLLFERYLGRAGK